MVCGSSNSKNEKAFEVTTHDIPVADAMSEFMKQGWTQSTLDGISTHQSVPFTKVKREKISKQFVEFRYLIFSPWIF